MGQEEGVKPARASACVLCVRAGNPKGVVLSHRAVLATISGLQGLLDQVRVCLRLHASAGWAPECRAHQTSRSTQGEGLLYGGAVATVLLAADHTQHRRTVARLVLTVGASVVVCRDAGARGHGPQRRVL